MRRFAFGPPPPIVLENPLKASDVASRAVNHYLETRVFGLSEGAAREIVGETNRFVLQTIAHDLLGPYAHDRRVREYGEQLEAWGSRACKAALSKFVELHERRGFSVCRARRRTISYVAKKHPAPAPSFDASRGPA